MGTAAIPIKSLMLELGFDVVLPPPVTKETLSLGSRYSPEFACLPLKVNIGSYLQVLPQKPDVIFMAGGIGPCRFGLYGEVQKEILHSLGHDLDFVILEPPKEHPLELWQQLARFLGDGVWRKVPRALFIAYKKMMALDNMEKFILTLSPRLDPKWRKKLWQEKKVFLRKIDEAAGAGQVDKITRETREKLASFPEEKSEIIRIMLVGEIFIVLEPGTNFHLEENLSLTGVEVNRTVFFSDWLKKALILSPLGVNWQKEYADLAGPYLTRFIGGHGLESVAYTMKAIKEGYDGIIHLAPFGCMPEVVAVDIIQHISREKRFPTLSLLLDEHASDTGIFTRVEAFVDLMKNRKKRSRTAPALLLQ